MLQLVRFLRHGDTVYRNNALLIIATCIIRSKRNKEQYTHLQINLVFARHSSESFVYDVLQLNVLPPHVSVGTIFETSSLKTLQQFTTGFAFPGAHQEEDCSKEMDVNVNPPGVAGCFVSFRLACAVRITLKSTNI
ncbi:hypothetical protein CSKR_108728 [Clonorchis sinensis]|uniref:Uncharacterized protein n=1 Tax=Clonorchis sinensis TaxID=79923 RepID=A0A3R7FFE7_CLOSI|nr:hypothetical protein CSKR_108728 [Clonorchis sinensis]